MPQRLGGSEDASIWTRPFTLAVAATTATFVGFYLLLPILPPYALDLGASKVEAGWLVTLFTLPAVIARTVTGPYLDRGGRKRMLVAGLLLIGLATAAYGGIETLPVLLLVRVGHGMGWGLATTAFGSLVSDLAPPSRRGEALGYWGMAPTAAMAVGPLAGQWLYTVSGYPGVFGSSALLALLSLGIVLSIAHVAPSVIVHARSLLVFPKEARLPAATQFLSSLAYGGLIAFLPVELAARGGGSGVYFTVYALAILVARPFAGRLSDRFGRASVIHPALVLSAAGTALLGLASSPAALLLSAALYGTGVGSSFPALMAFTVDRAPVASRGAALASFFTAFDLAMAAGAALLGPIYERFGFLSMNLGAASGILLAELLFVSLLLAEARRGFLGPDPPRGELRK